VCAIKPDLNAAILEMVQIIGFRTLSSFAMWTITTSTFRKTRQEINRSFPESRNPGSRQLVVVASEGTRACEPWGRGSTRRKPTVLRWRYRKLTVEQPGVGLDFHFFRAFYSVAIQPYKGLKYIQNRAHFHMIMSRGLDSNCINYLFIG